MISMRYFSRITNHELKSKYSKVIGWGTGMLFRLHYREDYFDMDYVIDGTEKNVGKTINGVLVKGPDALELENNKVLVVIYAIYEKEILEQIKPFDHGQIDVIIYPLVDIILKSGHVVPKINGKSCEDLLVFSLIQQIGLKSIKFLEIGVCHPVFRNNSYLLNELFSTMPDYKGVLVEANPTCWDLIEDYRPQDKLLKMGAGGDISSSSAKFYMFPNLLGHSTFSKSLANEVINRGYKCEEINVEVEPINKILSENFDETPDILFLDAEGLDIEILQSCDLIRWPFKVIVFEAPETEKEYDFMSNYYVYARTVENIILVKKDIKLLI